MGKITKYLGLSTVVIAAMLITVMVRSPQHVKAATIITVNSTADTEANDGECTLREAITAANTDTASGVTPGECDAGSGADTIEFAIAPFDGSVKTITPTSVLIITEPVTIDGYTQDDATPNTAISPLPFDGTLRVEIDGSGGGDNIFLIDGSADGSTISGLVLNRSPGTAIIINAPNITVRGNYIGTDPTGTIGQGNLVGISWIGYGDHTVGRDATIGGLLPADRNILSGNATGSISSGSYPTDGWVFQGNYIGVDATGVTALPNSSIGGSGALSIDACSDVVVGGTQTGAANVISGNLSHGLAPDGAVNLLVQGNFIGTDYTGTVAIGNGAAGLTVGNTSGLIGGSISAARNIISNSDGDGIFVNQSDGLTIQGNYIGTGSTGTEVFPNSYAGIAIDNGSINILIGGTSIGSGNLISNNLQSGINVTNSATKATILGNSIYSNDLIGIDLGNFDGVTLNDSNDVDTGPNDLLNFPVYTNITEASGNTTVEYNVDVPAGDYRVEFYANMVADPTGNGEGETFLGFANITSSGTGSQSYSKTLTGITGANNMALTITERNVPTASGFGATSEFGGPEPPINDVAVTKSLDDPEDVAPGATITYSVTYTNNGPDSLDLTQFDGSGGLGTNDLFLDVYPSDMTYASVITSDITCTDAGPGSAAMFGPVLANHNTYGLLFCDYTGGPATLASGESSTVQLQFIIANDSSLSFTNYVLAIGTLASVDPDGQALSDIIDNGVDIIDGSVLGSINNVAGATFPIPVTPPTPSGSGSSGSGNSSGGLGITGQNAPIYVFAGSALLSVAGYIHLTCKRRKSYSIH